MKAASLSELKQELTNISKADLLALCLRLARYKKDNKELLTFLVFESNDVEAYIKNVDDFITKEFSAINYSNAYFAKKSLRKILRLVNKYIKYTGSKQVEATLLIRFCTLLKNTELPAKKNSQIQKMFLTQLAKIDKSIETLHPDLAYDYKKQADELALPHSSKFLFS
jgi:hypothetical protein